jgi:hypothetical protein
MESEGLLPCSQRPATGSYPESDESSSHSRTLYYLTIYAKSSMCSFSLGFSDQSVVYIKH